MTDVYTKYRPAKQLCCLVGNKPAVVGLILLCRIKPTTAVSTSKFCGKATKFGSVPTKA